MLRATESEKRNTMLCFPPDPMLIVVGQVKRIVPFTSSEIKRVDWDPSTPEATSTPMPAEEAARDIAQPGGNRLWKKCVTHDGARETKK